MTEIAPGLRVVLAPNPGPMTLDGTNTWILGSPFGGDGGPSIVVDPGPHLCGSPGVGMSQEEPFWVELRDLKNRTAWRHIG